MGHYRKILVVLNAARDFEPTLREAVALAKDQNAILALLFVVPEDLPRESVFGLIRPPERRSDDVARMLDQMPQDIAFTYRVERWESGTSIAREVRHGGVDLLVMSRGHRSRRLRWFSDLYWTRIGRIGDVPVLLV